MTINPYKYYKKEFIKGVWVLESGPICRYQKTDSNYQILIGQQSFSVEETSKLAARFFKKSPNLENTVLCLRELKYVISKIERENNIHFEEPKDVLTFLLKYAGAQFDYLDLKKIKRKTKKEPESLQYSKPVLKSAKKHLNKILVGEKISFSIINYELHDLKSKVSTDIFSSPIREQVEPRRILVQNLFNEFNYFYELSKPIWNEAVKKHLYSKDHKEFKLLRNIARINNIDLASQSCKARNDETSLIRTVFYEHFKKSHLEEMLKFGIDLSLLNGKGAPLLHEAIFNGVIHQVRWLLSKSEIDPRKLDYHGRNALHCAYIGGNSNIIKLLERHPSFKECLSIQDDYGYLPDDYRNGKTIPRKSINQQKIINSIFEYFTLENREINKFSHIVNGLCNGLIFQRHLIEDQEFFQSLELICNLQISKEMLENKTELNGLDYTNVKHFLETWISNVIFFQGLLDNIDLKIAQSDRKLQFEIVNKSGSDRGLKEILKMTTIYGDMEVKKEKLEVILNLLQTFKKEAKIEVNICQKHMISIEINKDGILSLYDPNSYYEVKATPSAKEIASIIIRKMYFIESVTNNYLKKDHNFSLMLFSYFIGKKKQIEEWDSTIDLDLLKASSRKIGIPLSLAAKIVNCDVDLKDVSESPDEIWKGEAVEEYNNRWEFGYF